MTVQLSPNGKWLYGDAAEGGIAAILANTIVAMREEVVGVNSTQGTWVMTSQGVSAIFDGQQTVAIYDLIKDIDIIIV